MHRMLATMLLAIGVSATPWASVAAQETPTERTAAAAVLRRMADLERSLALPQLVARLSGARDARRDAVIARAKDRMDRELLAMADDITRHPETGWKEEGSVKILTDYLNAHHFTNEAGEAGQPPESRDAHAKGRPGPHAASGCAAAPEKT